MAVEGFWKLDQTSGTTATATTGSNGTYTRDASNTTTAGPGGVVTLGQNFVPASSDAVAFTALNYADTVAFSVCGWHAPDTTSQVILGRNAGGRGIDILNATTIRVLTGSVTRSYTVPTISAGTWYFYLVTREITTNNMRLWWGPHGGSLAESSSGTQVGTGTINFDRIGSLGASFSDGKHAYVRVFDSEESANRATYFAEGNSNFQAAWALNSNQ